MSLIILEGPDGAGKSTLIEKLAHDFEYPIYRSGGPKDPETMLNVLAEMEILAKAPQTYLCDRTPWISEIIYSLGLGRAPVLDIEVFKDYYKLPQRIIYCNLDTPERMLTNMSLAYKPHKPKDHTKAVIENHKFICELYEDLMGDIEVQGIDIFEYDWGTVSYSALTQWIGE